MFKIIHVDDDRDVREITKMVLELYEEFEVLSCGSGEEALCAIDQFTPDVFLLDVMMPDLDGPQIFEKIRVLPRLAEVPVIFLTVRAAKNQKDELWQIGPLDVITKPFDPLSLASQIKAVLNNMHDATLTNLASATFRTTG